MTTLSYGAGASLVLISAFFFGIQPLFGEALKQANVDAYALNLIRYTVPALLLAGWFAMRGRVGGAPLRYLIRHSLLGLGFVGAGVGYYQAGFEIGFGLAVILFFSFPLMVTLYSLMVLRIQLRPIQIIAMLSALAGLALAVDVQWDESGVAGIAWALLAGFSYAGALIYKTHYVPPLDDTLSLLALMVGASVVMFIIVGVRGAALPDSTYSWSAAIGLSIFAGLIPIGLLMLGTRAIGSLDSATLCTLEPIVAISVSVWLLGESASWNTLLGGVLVIGSAAVLMRARQRTEVI